MRNIITSLRQVGKLLYKPQFMHANERKIIFKKLQFEQNEVLSTPEQKINLFNQINIEEEKKGFNLKKRQQVKKEQSLIDSEKMDIIEDQGVEESRIPRKRSSIGYERQQNNYNQRNRNNREEGQKRSVFKINRGRNLTDNNTQTKPTEKKTKFVRKDLQFLQKKLFTEYNIPIRTVKLADELQKMQIRGAQTIDDIPFNVTTQLKQQAIARAGDQVLLKDEKIEVSKDIFGILALQYIQSLCSQQPVEGLSIQPNFELQIRKTMKSISNGGFKFNIKKISNKQPQVAITQVMHLKGLRVIRNQNFKQEQYVMVKENEDNGLIEYLPIKQETDRYPEIAYKNIDSMILQVTCSIELPISIQVTQKNKKVHEHKNTLKHIVTFENQLRLPPMFSEWTLDKFDFIKSYRIQKSGWTITNFDKKNKFAQFLYPEEQKETLINKIVWA